MSKSTAVMGNFSGGWNCDAEASMLKPNELAEADNIDLLAGGGFETRLGRTALNSTPYGNTETTMTLLYLIKWTKKDGTLVMLGVFKNVASGTSYSLFQVGLAGGALTNITTLMSADVSFDFHRDYILILNGGTDFLYSGGTTATTASVRPIQVSGVSAAPTVTTQTGGTSGAGIYKCMYTYINSLGAESLIGDATTITVAASSKFVWTNIIYSSNSELTARKLYRTKVGGEVFYYVNTISDNTTNSFVDNIADVDLVTKFETDNIITTIEKCKYIIHHPRSGRYFAAGNPDYPYRLYWSDIDNPGYWGADDYYDPESGAGPTIGLDIYADGLLVIYQSCFYVWRGIDPGSIKLAVTSGDVTWSKLPVDHGVVHRRAACRTPGTYSFLSLGGIWTLNTLVYSDINVAVVETENMVKNITVNKVQTELDDITNMSLSRMLWDVPRQQLLLAYTTQAGTVTYADRLLVYHWGKGGGFTRYTNLKIYDMCLMDNGDLYISSGDTVYKLFTGSTDAGAAIEARITTAFFDFGSSLVRKKLKKVYLNGASGGPSSSTIEMQVNNGSKTVRLNPITFVGQGAKWTSAYTWNDANIKWGSSKIKALSKERVVQGILEGQSFQLKIFHDNLGKQTKFSQIGMEYIKYKVKGERS
jgi:hypothetical protein